MYSRRPSGRPLTLPLVRLKEKKKKMPIKKKIKMPFSFTGRTRKRKSPYGVIRAVKLKRGQEVKHKYKCLRSKAVRPFEITLG